MNQKNLVMGVVSILFAAVFIFSGCQPIIDNGNESDREGAFNKDSLLIEVWDQSIPPKFLGYDTGMMSNDRPIILTSKGYCVEINHSFQNRTRKSFYGHSSVMDQGMSWDEFDENNKLDWGCQILFAKTTDPNANDRPYLGAANHNRFIVNQVFYNPHNGGTYYTWDGTIPQSVNFPPNFKMYHPDGTIHTSNEFIDDRYLDYSYFTEYSPLKLNPLKKIGGYSELGLPNPDEVTGYLMYKVR